ncbi:MAG: catalase [Proteobacteria bacterium]|nr:catalase [Pseudomonadota bacterium]
MSGLGISGWGIGNAASTAEGYRSTSLQGEERHNKQTLPGITPEEPEPAVLVSFSGEALSQAQEAEETEDRREPPNEISDAEKKEIQKLQRRDQEVRRHEQAHVAAGGSYVRGGANLQYSRGPDGRMYATGGEVSIDVSAERTPEATIQKAQVVRRAALAPAEPSGQDRAVAAAAGRLETQARQELSKKQMVEMKQAAETEPQGMNPPEKAKAPDSVFETSATPVTGPKTLDIRI